jgi:peptide/nickel transport system permease protein
MGRYIVRRAVQGLIALFILVTVVFFLARVAGNPIDLMLPPEASEEAREYWIHRIGLDKPFHVQYFNFVTSLAKGDLGDSIRFNRPVLEMYMNRLPASMSLLGVTVLIVLLISLPLGVIAGAYRGSSIDQIAKFVAVMGAATPVFWFGLVLIQIFAVQLGVLPGGRIGGIRYHILPAFSQAFFTIAGIARLLRSSMMEAMDSEYVKLARIKGVSQRMVIWKHCFRNSLISVLSFCGMQFAIMIGGSIVTETVFAWPGIGRLIYEGIMLRDYPVVQGCVLLNGIVIIIFNLLIDVFYSYIDPRIRHE